MDNFIDALKFHLNVTLREKLNPFFAKERRNKIATGKDKFTIISNTCWAGHVYRYFGLPYNTPTIGIGFFADEYLKFLKDIPRYLSMELVEMKAEESKYYNIIKTQPAKFQTCPYARLGDLELRFAHYKTFEKAKQNWDRRCKRVNLDHLIIKFSEHMGCREEHLREFDNLPYKTKFVFVTKDYGLKSQVISSEWSKLGDVKDDTIHFRRYIDLVKLINGESFKINQPK